MSIRSITGRNALTGQCLKITVDGDRIATIAPGPPDESTWLAPGFIDLQVNGYGGCDLNGDTVDADLVISLVERLAATGVTTFLPTLITAPEANIVRALQAIAKARSASALAAHAIPFVHVEGPFLSPDDGAYGAHPREQIRPPDLAEFERWQAASGEVVGMITVSPHWQNAAEFIRALAGKGILIAIGHTNASPEQIHAAADAGATLSTHLGNGIASVLPRHPNPIWAQLADDRFTATFIADGYHLPADTLKSMLRAKTVARSIFISDSTSLAGMQPGAYRAAIGGDVELHADGRLNMKGTNLLAGAALPLKDGVAQAASSGICTPAEAVRMATENPGRLVGNRGMLREGATADLVRFTIDRETKRMNMLTVLSEGAEQ